MPVGVLAKLKVKPELQAEFEQAFLQYQEKVRTQEPGNIFFALHKARDAAGEYTVIEQYVDETALLAHRSSDYYKTIPDILGPFMAAPPEIVVLDSVG